MVFPESLIKMPLRWPISVNKRFRHLFSGSFVQAVSTLVVPTLSVRIRANRMFLVESGQT